MREFTAVYVNAHLHGHPPCWRVWAKTWGWYLKAEFATKQAADDEAEACNYAWEQTHRH